MSFAGAPNDPGLSFTPPGVVRTVAQQQGFTLSNGVSVLSQWVAPADGNEHLVLVAATVNVTVAATGGAINASYTSRGQAITATMVAGSQGLGTFSSTLGPLSVDPGSTVQIVTTALSAGSATVDCCLAADHA